MVFYVIYFLKEKKLEIIKLNKMGILMIRMQSVHHHYHWCSAPKQVRHPVSSLAKAQRLIVSFDLVYSNKMIRDPLFPPIRSSDRPKTLKKELFKLLEIKLINDVMPDVFYKKKFLSILLYKKLLILILLKFNHHI